MTDCTKRAGTSLCTCLYTQTHHKKAGPFSVARLKMDLPSHNLLAYNHVHRRSASPLGPPPFSLLSRYALSQACSRAWRRAARAHAASGCRQVLLLRARPGRDGAHRIDLRCHRPRGEPPHIIALRHPANTQCSSAKLMRNHPQIGQAYAMTEAAHQMCSNPLPKHGPRKPGTVGRATVSQPPPREEQPNWNLPAVVFFLDENVLLTFARRCRRTCNWPS